MKIKNKPIYFFIRVIYNLIFKNIIKKMKKIEKIRINQKKKDKKRFGK